MEYQSIDRKILTHLGNAFSDLICLLDPDELSNFSTSIGLSEILDSTLKDDLVKTIENIINCYDKIREGNGNVELYKNLISSIKSLLSNIKKISTYYNLNYNELLKKALNYTLLRYIDDNLKEFDSLLNLLGLIKIIEDPNKPNYSIREFDSELFRLLLTNPTELVRFLYGWPDNLDLKFLFDKFLYLADSFGVGASSYSIPIKVRQKINYQEGDYEIRIPIYRKGIYEGVYEEIGLAITPLTNTNNKRGVLFTLFINGQTSNSLYDNEFFSIDFTSSTKAGCISLILAPEDDPKILLNHDGNDNYGDFHLTLNKKKEIAIPILNDFSGFYLNITQFSFDSHFIAKLNSYDWISELNLSDIKFVFDPREADSLIRRIISKPLELNFSLVLGWSITKGFYFKGVAGLEYTFAINKAIGPFFINTFDIGLKTTEDGIGLLTGITGNATLGPVIVTTKKLGLKANIDFNTPGLLGNADLDVGFAPPEAIGLAIDAQGVKGGGFLAVKNGNYAGILQLSVQDKFTVTAIGILITRTPEDKKIFSLKLFGMVEFSPPIQVGFGFSISGIGIAVAIECRLNEQALRDAVYKGSLRSLLFPPDPIANAVQVINDLNAFFPPAKDSFVIGAMVKIGWGSGNPLIKADVGIFVEISNNVRIALAGIAYAILPNEESPVLVLNIQVVGLIDFNEKTFAIDSSLKGSKLLDWPLDGGVALRSCWGDNPGFVFSSGGFYPGYRPPADFPALDRISITIGNGNPQIGLLSYLAVTENSVQFGAHLNFYWHKRYTLDLLLKEIHAHVEVSGGTGFDAIFEFNPFRFTAGMEGNFNLKCNGDSILSVQMFLKLEGPNPYHLTGQFEFEIFSFDFTVSLDEWFGRKIADKEPPSVNPLKLLMDELEKSENWTVKASPTHMYGVIYASEDLGYEKYADPDSPLVFNQKVMPLDLTIEKIGQVDTKNEKYDIVLDSEMLEFVRVENLSSSFAPGQFINLREAEKIVSPPFVNLKSGCRIQAIEKEMSAFPTESRVMSFEDIVFFDGSPTPETQSRPIHVSDNLKHAITQTGRVLYTNKTGIKREVERKTFRQATPSYSVIGLSPESVRLKDSKVSYYEALALAKSKRNGSGKLHIVSDEILEIINNE